MRLSADVFRLDLMAAVFVRSTPSVLMQSTLRSAVRLPVLSQCVRIPVRFSSIRTSKSTRKMFPTFSWKAFGVSSAIIAGFIGYGMHLKKQKLEFLERERRRSLGKASIGGQFELVDQDGKPCTSKDFLGKWVLLYFGFTHCPDICPEEMEKMVKVTEELGKLLPETPLVPLFITVDPERDSPAIVKSYINEFSPKIIGLTGTKEQVDKATKAFRVYYSAGPKDEDQDYIVDHTIIMYLIDPDGEFVDYYGQTKTPEQVANGIIFSIKKYNASHKKSWF